MTSTESKTSDVAVQVSDGIARITLQRPEKVNAITPEMMSRLHDILWDVDDDSAVHCVVLRGAGRSFSAGYDLGAGGYLSEQGARRGTRSFDDDAWRLERAQRNIMPLFDMHKPTIAQVHGHCLAGATDLASLCDMVICADDAVIGFPAARDLGVLPQQMWLFHVGPQWAKRLLLTGDSISGAEAAQIGFALKSVPAHLLEAEVEGLGRRLALIDPELLAANKRIVNLGLELMGARTLQRLAAETDARGHQVASAREFRQRVADVGLRVSLRERDAKFGDGRARVNGPELRDESGRLMDEPDLGDTEPSDR